MQKETNEAIAAHRDGRRVLSDEDLEHHTRRKNALERKRASMEAETPEKVRLFFAPSAYIFPL